VSLGVDLSNSTQLCHVGDKQQTADNDDGIDQPQCSHCDCAHVLFECDHYNVADQLTAELSLERSKGQHPEAEHSPTQAYEASRTNTQSANDNHTKQR